MNKVKLWRLNHLFLLFVGCATMLHIGCASTSPSTPPTTFQPQHFQGQRLQYPGFQSPTHTNFPAQRILSQTQAPSAGQYLFAGQAQNTQPQNAWSQQQFLATQRVNYPTYPYPNGFAGQPANPIAQGAGQGNLLPSFQGNQNMLQASQYGNPSLRQIPLGFAGTSC